MCDPTGGIASAAISGLSAVTGAGQALAGYGQSVQAADRQNQFAANNQVAANVGLANEYNADQTQMTEERTAASQEAMQSLEKSTAAQSTAVTAAGAAGVGGLSVDQLASNIAARGARVRSDLDENYSQKSAYMGGVEQSQQDQTISRINSVPTVAQPSFLSAGLGILGAGVSGAGQYYRDTYLSQPWKQGGPAPMNPEGYSN